MTRVVYIGAGCFWGVEAYYQKIKGVMKTEVGYANGPANTISYEEVCAGSGHVEVAKITFNSNKLSLLELFTSYLRIIDPYSKNKQGNDVGIQYRIGLYLEDTDLLQKLKTILKTWEHKNLPTEIEIMPLINYVPAEDYHQDYLLKNEGGYCHINLSDIPDNLQK